MAGMVSFPSLVYHHTSGPLPPVLSASGTSLSSNLQEMASGARDNEPPQSSSSSDLRSPRLYTTFRSSTPYFREPPNPFTHFSAPSEHRNMSSERYRTHNEESGVGPDRGSSHRRAARQAETEASLSYVKHDHRSLAYITGTSRPASPASPAHLSQDQQESQESLPPSSSQGRFLPSHCRSTSDSASSSLPRSTSPALSAVSTPTSVSSHNSAPVTQVFKLPNVLTTGVAGRAKHRKQRLYDIDRKNICLYAAEHPYCKQEEIARQFNVERSTVSKILKHKEEWLETPDHRVNNTAKRRLPKWSIMETRMQLWVEECSRRNILMTDALIRQRALDILGPLSGFKASSGWVENFKRRIGIRKGIWYGLEGEATAKWLRDGRNGVIHPSLPEHNRFSPLPEDNETLPLLPPNPEPPNENTSPLPVSLDLTNDHMDGDEPTVKVRRHPVWLSPDQSGDADRHHVAPRNEGHGAPGHHATDQPHVDPTADPYAPPPYICPENLAVPVYAEDGTQQLVVPAPPTFRPDVDDEPSITDAENAIDTLIYFERTNRGLFGDDERALLATMKRKLFLAANDQPYR